MSVAVTAGKLAWALADPGKAGVPGVAAPRAPAGAPLVKEIPEIVVDPHSWRRYVRGRFLVKGGFAKCLEVSDVDTKEVFVGKIVPKIVLGCQYLHRNGVIHQDLKLGNLFLNEDLEVKIGDFGLATKVEYDGERKKTLCGTPNYITPEELRKGSFEVEVWSTGCIMLGELPACASPGKRRPVVQETSDVVDYHLSDTLQQLHSVNSSKPSERGLIRQEEAEDPACIPIFWVSKWVDYSDKYGLVYQLCDNSMGVLFNDSTRLILCSDGDSLQYTESAGTESYLTVSSHPNSLRKKITLLKCFRNYMSEHLLKAGANISPHEGDELAWLPYLQVWFCTQNAIILHLSNGSVQINFFQNHTKLILCPLMAAVTYIDEKWTFRMYCLSLLEEYGCCKEPASRLCYACTMVYKLLSLRSANSLKAS
ncbi:Serine/threonine-protein kinase PLK1 [Plecturocebus cupreus]